MRVLVNGEGSKHVAVKEIKEAYFVKEMADGHSHNVSGLRMELVEDMGYLCISNVSEKVCTSIVRRMLVNGFCDLTDFGECTTITYAHDDSIID